MGLHVLIVGQGPEIGMLSDFITRRDCRVEHCPEGQRAAAYVQHRRAHQVPYQIVLVDVATAGVDPLALGQQLLAIESELVVSLMVDFTQVASYLGPAKAVGINQVFDQPVDLSKLDSFLRDQEHLAEAGLGTTAHSRGTRLGISGKHRLPEGGGGSGGYRPTTARQGSGRHSGDNTPFFGASRRLGDGSGTHATLPPVPGNGPAGTARQALTGKRRSVAGEQRQTTSRVRRSITGRTHRQDLANGTDQPAAKEPTKQVACAHCRQVMSVLVKPASYTMPCIHCGQLNRIMP